MKQSRWIFVQHVTDRSLEEKITDPVFDIPIHISEYDNLPVRWWEDSRNTVL